MCVISNNTTVWGKKYGYIVQILAIKAHDGNKKFRQVDYITSCYIVEVYMGNLEYTQNNKNKNFGGFYSPFVPVFWLYAKHLRSSGMIGYFCLHCLHNARPLSLSANQKQGKRGNDRFIYYLVT